MTQTTTTQVTVKLNPQLLTMAAELREAIASPLLPTVTLAETIRAAIRETHGRYVTDRQTPMAAPTEAITLPNGATA